jgi:dTDP-4-dehydrorhamnose 3,5-epimerase
MAYSPEGFAHGFQSLSDNSELVYLHSDFYNPEYEGGLRYNDPALAIEWPLPAGTLSAKDRSYPLIGSTEGSIEL